KEKKFEKAIEAFTRFQAQHVTSRYTVAINYNWGLALEALKRFQEAVEKYRFVIEIARGRAPLQEAQALYHIALCYEALGDDPKTIAALVDASNRRQYFSEETNVEISARLAAAYARVGNEKQADEYYSKAEKGLALMRRKIETKTPPSWLGKALYNMGKMPLRSLTLEDFAAGLKPLERGQGWLIQAASLRDETWSPKASFELIQAYRDAWALIEAVPLGNSDDQLVNMKEQQDKKIEMAVTLHEVISKLKLEKLPDERAEPKEVADVFTFVEKLETDVDALIGTRPVQHGLTPAAEQRQGIKREGKMVPVTEARERKPRPARLKKKRNKK
ncbi:MAG TPA: tetratricopeptide repeat protein, partial [Bdellovibrionales bacterium]|nr:tetratricopeptide repeat protein [Bdellovibrionales bacterium]